MKISRAWATPITIGAFIVMSVTGLLMFFHLERGMNKLAHEWIGLVMVAGVILHTAANWLAFKQYFITSGWGRAIIALGVVALAGSFASLPGAADRLPPPVLAMKAIAKAPLASVAPLTGRPVEQLVADLAKAGVKLASVDASIDSVAKGDRGVQSKAMNVLFGKQSEKPAGARVEK